MNEQGRQESVACARPRTPLVAADSILGCLQSPTRCGCRRGDHGRTRTKDRPEETPVLITPQDLAPPSDFADTSEYPVSRALGPLNQYDRPWPWNAAVGRLRLPRRGTGHAERPARTDHDRVFEGDVLTVGVQASRTRSGRRHRPLHATVSGGNAASSLYRWNFDGAATARRARHRRRSSSPRRALRRDRAGHRRGRRRRRGRSTITVGSPASATRGTTTSAAVGQPRTTSAPPRAGPHQEHRQPRRRRAPAHAKPRRRPRGNGNASTSTPSHTSTTPTRRPRPPPRPRLTTPAPRPRRDPRDAAAPPRRTAHDHPGGPDPDPRVSPAGHRTLISDVIAAPPAASPLVHEPPRPSGAPAPPRAASRPRVRLAGGRGGALGRRAAARASAPGASSRGRAPRLARAGVTAAELAESPFADVRLIFALSSTTTSTRRSSTSPARSRCPS